MATVLIVEDSPTQQETIKRIVEKMGHIVVCAGDGAEAIVLAKEQKPELILMDIIMPVANGFQATRALKRDIETKDIPVIMITTKSEEVDRAWGLRQGAEAYLVKPFSEQELVELVRNALL